MKQITKWKIDLENEFNQLKEIAGQLVVEISVEAFNAKPDPQKWSIGQHLQHLNVTGDGYLAEIIKAIENAGNKINVESTAKSTIQEYKPRFLMQKFINEMEPPVKRKFKVPKAFTPSMDSQLDKEETLRYFIGLQDTFIVKMNEVVQANLLKVKITSPATSLFKLQLGEVFPLVTAHERRHLWLGEKGLKSF